MTRVYIERVTEPSGCAYFRFSVRGGQVDVYVLNVDPTEAVWHVLVRCLEITPDNSWVGYGEWEPGYNGEFDHLEHEEAVARVAYELYMAEFGKTLDDSPASTTHEGVMPS